MSRSASIGKSWCRFSPLAFASTFLVAVVILLLAWIVDVRLRMDAKAGVIEEMGKGITEQTHLIKTQLNDLSGTAASLSQIAASRMKVADGGWIPDEQMQVELLNFARTRGVFDQLQLVGPAGQEWINIRRVRSRAGSYYFRDFSSSTPRDLTDEDWIGTVFSLPAGAVSFSNIHWKLTESSSARNEDPTPLVRVAAAMQAEMGRQVSGYVVMEYLVENLLRQLDRADDRSGLMTVVATPDGEWIKAPRDVITPDGSAKKLFGEDWPEIALSSAGSFSLPVGVVVVETIGLAAEGSPLAMSSGPPQSWKIFSWTPQATIDAIEADASRPVMGWGLLAWALFLPLTWLMVTDREKKREASRGREQSRKLLESIAETSIDGIVAGEAVRDEQLDVCDFRLVFINPAGAHILQSLEEKDAAREREFPMFFAPDFFARCVEVVAMGTRYETEQQTVSDVLGTRWFRIVVVRMGDGIVMTFSEITEQKRSLQELSLARETADVANHAKSQFLNMMGHEIRTPMNGLLGFAALLERTDLTEEQRDYASTLRLSGEALLRILEDILDYSQMESEVLHMKSLPVDVSALVNQVAQLYATAVADRRLELVVRIDPEVPAQILGDDVRLRQVLVNLLGNAFKFTDEGFILIKVVLERRDRGEFLVFHVVDSGSGISPEMVDRLFKPFSQVDVGASRKYGGTGLGLSICRRLVESMGGEINVQSAPDKGSDFNFSLPVHRPDFPLPDPVQTHANPQDGDERKARILVVDDDLINRKLILRMIEKVGAQAKMADCGAQALAIFAGTEFDLILMDLQMPGMDGFETTRRIRDLEKSSGHERRTPISALTANADDENRERCIEAGMDDFFCKPIRIETLEELIERNTSV